jgi:hypothetical protein
VDSPRGVPVRSYRDVVDVVERRIFRIDRWRLPTPHGVSVRALAYAGACLAGVAVASGLPGVGRLLALLPGSVRYLALPALGGWALSTLSIDGRPPHHALLAAVRHRLGARTIAGLRGVPAVGSEFAPLTAIQIAPAGDEGRYRAGRIRGPATITLRYPAELTVERGGLRIAGDRGSGLAGARRIRVRALPGRPLVAGREVGVPESGEVVFE